MVWSAVLVIDCLPGCSDERSWTNHTIATIIAPPRVPVLVALPPMTSYVDLAVAVLGGSWR
jgi:hypothetical protein